MDYCGDDLGGDSWGGHFLFTLLSEFAMVANSRRGALVRGRIDAGLAGTPGRIGEAHRRV